MQDFELPLEGQHHTHVLLLGVGEQRASSGFARETWKKVFCEKSEERATNTESEVAAQYSFDHRFIVLGGCFGAAA